MTDDVIVDFPQAEVSEVNPDVVLQASIGNLEDCIVIGTKLEDGTLFVGMSNGHVARALMLLEVAKMKLLQAAIDYD